VKNAWQHQFATLRQVFVSVQLELQTRNELGGAEHFTALF
jgi:hypothetical protein